jgi:membrane fusion protein (multidrug efflux system)
MMRAMVQFGLCLLTVGIGVAVVYFFALAPMRAAALAPPEPTPPQPGTNVHVEVLVPAVFEDMLYLTGQALAWEQIDIASEGNGNLEAQKIEVGQAVKKGDILFHIDTIAIQADLAQAQARVKLAQQERTRAEGLRKSGVASPQLLDQALAEETLASAALRALEVRLERSITRAPIDGVISSLHKELGEYVDFGTPLCEIVQSDRLNIAIPVPERDIAKFALGDSVAVSFDAFPDKQFTGTIFRMQPTADLATRTYPIEIELPNPDGLLRPGMTARAAMVRERYTDAITVPLFAIRPMENQYFVVLEKEGIAHLRQIMPGKMNGDRVHVLSGLAAGERLIISGQRDLREGAPVIVRELPAPN